MQRAAIFQKAGSGTLILSIPIIIIIIFHAEMQRGPAPCISTDTQMAADLVPHSRYTENTLRVFSISILSMTVVQCDEI